MRVQRTFLPENRDEPDPLITRPTPALIIAVGDFAARAVRKVQRIYLRSDTHRAAACGFYVLAPDQVEGMKLAELGTFSDTAPSLTNASFLEQRQAALRSVIEHAPSLKARIEHLLHEQRVHERLIAAGWSELYDVPLNFYILADVGDPWAAGTLLPLGAILNEVVANTNLCQAHWLLSTAVFPESAPDQDLAVWSFLDTFDDFLRPKSEQREALIKALKFHNQQAPDFAVYLFDSRKEGTAMVKDPASLSTLLGNALLALLQRDLARRFFQERDEDILFEFGSYFNSIGAAGLIYDPDALQHACATRIGYAFLAEKILSTTLDGQIAIQHASQLQEQLGGLVAWLESVSAQLPLAVGQVHIQPETLEMTALLTDLVLSPLDYEWIRETLWDAQMESYEAEFIQETLPVIARTLKTNGEQLETHLKEILHTSLNQLPLEARLYPGGLDNARQVLDIASAYIQKIADDVEKSAEMVRDRQSRVVETLAAQRQRMKTLLAKAPILAWWIRSLPISARHWLAPLYLARRYGRQLYQAQSLRDECLGLLQQLCGLRIEQQALEQVRDILPGLQAQVQQAQAALAVFHEKLTQAAQSFSPEWGAFPLTAGENGWDELFRQPVTDLALANWAYEQWQPDLDAWVHEFLGARPLFMDWQTVEVSAVAAWVHDQAAQAYHPVWTLDLEAVFSLWAGNHFGSQIPGSTAEKPLSAQTIATCMSVAYPPIRADFDVVGGSNGSSVTFHALTCCPDWQHCRLPPAQSGLARWQAVYTGDSYTALFIKVRRNIQLRSLCDSFQNTWKRLEDLPYDQRQAYHLLVGLEQAGPPMVETVDPDSPDLVHKNFQWKFRPKGSSKEVEQTVELAISRARFEYYRRQPRYHGQWNVYAELEMPEVRDLAAEFQKLHADHTWSTFNQAYNVLKFVQNCIPYSFDKDTTGHDDWARYPIETLMEGTGDCEDVAILCAAVIARLGFQVVLLQYPNHLAIGVAGADNLKGDYLLDPNTGLRYFYGEATADGWHLGEIPTEYVNGKLEQILPVRILVCEPE